MLECKSITMTESDAIKDLQRQIENLQLQLNVKKSSISTTSGGLPDSKHLNGQNYAEWKFQMKNFLIDAGLWNCIEPSEVGEVNTELDQRALAKICLSIKPSVAAEIKKAKSAKEAWDKLKEVYEDKGVVRRIGLYTSLFRTRFEEFSTMDSYISHIVSIAEQLESIGKPLDNETVGGIILGGLPEKFRPLIFGIQGSNQSTTVEFVKNLLSQENIKCGVTSKSSNAFVSNLQDKNKKQSFKKIRCYNCNEMGHYSSQCKKPMKRFKISKSDKQIDNKYVNMHTDINYNENPMMKNWYLDSGCNAHMTARQDWLENFNAENNKSINVANGNVMQGKGTASVFIPIKNDKKINLETVIYAPELSANLLSVSQIVKRNKTVLFDINGCKILNKSINVPKSSVIVTAKEENGLYRLDTEEVFVCKTNLDITNLWHRRLGHLNYVYMKMLQNGMATGFGKEKFPTEPCISCIKGKQSRKPFPKCSQKRATEVLELIHTDVCGPTKTTSVGGARYFMTFTDDFSRKSFVYFLSSKDEVFDKFVEFKALVENETGKKIKILRSDNGGEYVSNAMNNFLKKNGIRHQLTIPRSAQQNGVAERLNRTLVEKARSMLDDSGLSRDLWAEAINTANYVKNRSPTKAVKHMTPEEAWTGKKPNISHLKIFGCKAMVHIPKSKRSKFDAKSEEKFFVGYGENTKGYRVIDPVTKKISFVRDVIFLENEFVNNCEVVLSPNAETDENHQNEEESYKNDSNDQIYEVDSGTQDDTESEISENQAPMIDQNIEQNEPNEDEEGSCSEESDNRPVRNRKPPAWLNDYDLSDTSFLCKESETYDEDWDEAIQNEIIAHIQNGTWEIVQKGKEVNIIGNKMILKEKFNSDGTLERKKARLVARGFAQRPNIDFFETFAPVTKLSSIRLLLGIAAEENLKLTQLDVSTAFLNGNLEEKVFMEVPKNLEKYLQNIISKKKGNKEILKKCKKMLKDLKINSTDKVCLLKKALYGLKQAGRQWFKKLDIELKSIGFKSSYADPCIYILQKGEEKVIIAVYVDDLIFASNSAELEKGIKEKLMKIFQMRDIGNLKYCLGIEFSQTKEHITANQSKYIEDLLKKFNMENCKTVATPLEPGLKLEKAKEDDKIDVPYQSLIGSLMYLSVATRPDITFTVSYLSQFNNCYNKDHWQAAKRVLRYLQGTKDFKLTFKKSEDPIIGYTDADWASCILDRRSYTGYCFTYAGAAISWESRKQKSVALSTAEAEYMALTEAAKEALHLKTLANDMGISQQKILIYNDNQAAKSLVENPIIGSKSKHISIKEHFIREVAKRKEIEVGYKRTEDMLADVLTKAVGGKRLADLRCGFGLCSS